MNPETPFVIETPPPGFRSGFVAIVGRPNVGKSTLLNALLGEKVAIVTHKPQTTRTRIHGILQRPEAQMVFVDTPGMCRGNSALHRTMRRIGPTAAADAEVAVIVTAVDRRADTPAIPEEDRQLVERARSASRAVIVAINKVDTLQPKSRLLPWIEHVAQELAADAIVPISAKRGEGLDALVTEVLARLPEGPPLFPSQMHTDQAERFLCQELVREQLLLQTGQEIPHGVAVIIESFEDGRPDDDSPAAQGSDRGLCRLEGRIIVERRSQKPIVIGKAGRRIRSVSEKARLEMEALLGSKVYLRLTVHVDENWTRNARALSRYGLNDG